MKKYNLFFCLFIVSTLVGCSSNDNDLQKKINNNLFNNVQKIVVVNFADPYYHSSTIKGKELSIVKNELKKINNIKIIKLDHNNYFEGYHLIYLFFNKSKKSKEILYSLNLKTVMIKETDVIPEKLNEQNEKSNETTIYQFIISERILEILKEHEQKLPKEGEFFSSWPLGDD